MSNTRFIPYKFEKHNRFSWETKLAIYNNILESFDFRPRTNASDLEIKREIEDLLDKRVEDWVKLFNIEHLDSLPTEPVEGYENYEIRESYWLSLVLFKYLGIKKADDLPPAAHALYWRATQFYQIPFEYLRDAMIESGFGFTLEITHP